MEKIVTIKCRDMIEALDLNGLSSEDKDNLIGQMSDIVCNRIVLQVMEKISEKEADELSNYLEDGDMDKVDKFLNEKVSDFSNIIQIELNNFQEELLKKNN
jgi:hypothetical protein